MHNSLFTFSFFSSSNLFSLLLDLDLFTYAFRWILHWLIPLLQHSVLLSPESLCLKGEGWVLFFGRDGWQCIIADSITLCRETFLHCSVVLWATYIPSITLSHWVLPISETFAILLLKFGTISVLCLAAVQNLGEDHSGNFFN